MAFHANPIRSLLRTFASAACLLAILLLITPCSTAQHQPAVDTMHCADCCNPSPTLTTPQFCCTQHSQPTQPSAVTTASPIIRTVEALAVPFVVPVAHYRSTLIAASSSPPPLHPILRI